MTLQGLEELKKLKILSIQSNRITKLEGLDGLENLEELYISHNGILKLEGLDKNVSISWAYDCAHANGSQPKLRTLDAGNNFIETLENISHLTSLEELWVRSSHPWRAVYLLTIVGF